MGRCGAVLQEATVNLSSSSATYGTLFGPAPERGTGLWHLIFHFDNGRLPVATGQPMRTPFLEVGSGEKKGKRVGYEDVSSKAVSLHPPPNLFQLVVLCPVKGVGPLGSELLPVSPAGSPSSIIQG